MRSSAVRRVANENFEGLTDEQRQMLADQHDSDSAEPLEPELETIIDEGLAYFEAGGKGVPHEVVMQRLRAVRAG